ncbi:TPA: DNA-directed RNA polymerase subunit D [archaeon]|uniref:DNA-directed RNA polymerase subunit Rpo3 n=1 Tax=Candidatus Naiadarchaeum limnaeum TaxID=2756139 RepID=A0A832VAH0_9ARCH|nr:DNA-directed RNA polymerase subunit D [Candidatus Naiadarchaeum limnaeum]
MKIEILEKENGSIKFVLDESNPAFANALRRIMIAEVPTLAIDEVEFFENNSALYDEMISHRLGLIPIITKLREYNFRDECTCKGKGCSSCTVTLSLSKKGPVTVYSGDLKSSDKEAVPADLNIPIVKLREGQKIKLEASAVLGRGRVHAKWQPGVISYKYFDEEKGKGDKFLFTVESNGSLKPEQIVAEAAKILGAKAKEFGKELK